jgi:hypothetical protein
MEGHYNVQQLDIATTVLTRNGQGYFHALFSAFNIIPEVA